MPNGAGGRAAGLTAGIPGDGNVALPAARPLPDAKAAGRFGDLTAQDSRGLRCHGCPDDAAERRQNACFGAGVSVEAQLRDGKPMRQP